MERILLVSTWMLSLLVALHILLGNRSEGPELRPENDGLSVGLRFPLLMLERLIEWRELSKAGRMAVLVASPYCSLCQTILGTITQLTREHPSWRMLLILNAPTTQLETLAAEYQWTTPAIIYTPELQRALNTHFFPTLYIIDSRGQILSRNVPHSLEDFYVQVGALGDESYSPPDDAT